MDYLKSTITPYVNPWFFHSTTQLLGKITDLPLQMEKILWLSWPSALAACCLVTVLIVCECVVVFYACDPVLNPQPSVLCLYSDQQQQLSERLAMAQNSSAVSHSRDSQRRRRSSADNHKGEFKHSQSAHRRTNSCNYPRG